jgi:glycosyltransferase involved in cell wall biosynthesis
MVVLHLISSAGCYGAENMLVTLAAASTRLGCRPVVAVFRDSRYPSTEVAESARRRGLPVEFVPCRGRWDWSAVRIIRGIVDGYGVQVLHTHGYKADVIGRAAAMTRPTAVVATCHNWPDGHALMRAYAVLDRLVLRNFDGVAAASELVAEVLRRSRVRDPEVLPNGVDLASFAHAAPALRGEMPAGCERLVGFVGRMVPEKGGAVLLQCAREVIRQSPRAGFILVGEGPARGEWESLARRFGIERNVVFAGARRDMPGVYSSLDLLVLPSLVEAMPMCLLEALASRVPVVATRVGSVSQVVIPGVTGLLVEPSDPSALAEAILRLLADRHLAQALAEQGHYHVARRFSAEAAAAAYIALYERALARRCGRRAGFLKPIWTSPRQ